MPVITAVRAEPTLYGEKATELAAVLGADAPALGGRQQAGHGIAEGATCILALLANELHIGGGQGIDSGQVIFHRHVCTRRPKAAASGLRSVVSGVSDGFSALFSLSGWRRAHHPVREPAHGIEILFGGFRRIPTFKFHDLPRLVGQSGALIGFANLGNFEFAEIVLRVRLPPLAQVKIECGFQSVK